MAEIWGGVNVSSKRWCQCSKNGCHPHVTFRGTLAPRQRHSFFLLFLSLSLTCPLLFLRTIMYVKLTTRLIHEVF